MSFHTARVCACRHLLFAGIFILVYLLFGAFAHVGHAATTSVIYQSDFSSDPQWITDEPENFYWDSASEALFLRTINRPDPNYSPSRHYYTETTLNPRLSYELSFDIFIIQVEGGGPSGVAVFGLYGDRLHGFNPLNLNFVGNDQDGTFSLRLMTLEGISQFIWTGVNPGYNYDIGKVSTTTPFDLGVWYHVIERYNASTHSYFFELRERDSNAVIFTRVIEADPSHPVNPALQNLGASMHPEGQSNTNLGFGTRINGFTEYLVDNVTLTQVYDETYTEPSSVLFLPGIQSSRLYRSGLLGSEDQIWEPNINSDVAQLAMTEVGESIEEVYTRDVIDSALGFVPVYDDFLTYLTELENDGTISDHSVYAYDWRYAVDDVITHGTRYETEQKYLVELVRELAKHTNSHVTVIGHSNGGLLAKALVKELEAQGLQHLVDKVILVATPQLGTPKVIGSLLHGLDQEQFGGLLIDDMTARETMRNMPGAYGLVPSAQYFTGGQGSGLVRFEEKTTTADFVSAYGTSIDTRDELIDFLSGTDGRAQASAINEAAVVNTAMADAAQSLHDAVLDPWVAPAPMQVFEIVGVGLDTIKGFHYKEFAEQHCIPSGPTIVCDQDVYYEPVPILTRYGDETVVEQSASAYTGDKQTYFVDLLESRRVSGTSELTHANIMRMPELQQLLTGLLQNQNVAVPFFSTTMPTFSESRDLIAVHSPVELSVRDAAGRRVGKAGSGETERVVTDIPGSAYLEFGGGKYVVVPSSVSYEVVVQGKGEDGSYTLAVDSLVGEEMSESVVHFLATTTPNMEASLVKGGGVFGVLEVDYEGDGVVDETAAVAPEATTAELFTALRTLFASFTQLKAKDRQWLINNVNKAENAGMSKGYGSSAVLRIFDSTESKLVQYEGQGRISQVEHTSARGFMDEIIMR